MGTSGAHRPNALILVWRSEHDENEAFGPWAPLAPISQTPKTKRSLPSDVNGRFLILSRAAIEWTIVKLTWVKQMSLKISWRHLPTKILVPQFRSSTFLSAFWEATHFQISQSGCSYFFAPDLLIPRFVWAKIIDFRVDPKTLCRLWGMGLRGAANIRKWELLFP